MPHNGTGYDPTEDDLEGSFLLDRIGSMVYPSASHPEAPSATVAQTCFIILSIYIGLGMLSQPFGLRLGGWAALIALGGTAALFFLSATLLGKASDLLPPGSQRTFPVLGGKLAGPAGRSTVSGLAALELFGAVTIAIVVVLAQLELLLPAKVIFSLSPVALSCIIAVAGLIPALSLKDVSRLAPIAAAGSGASAAVAIAVLCLLVVDPNREHVHQPPASRDVALWPGIMQSVGIFAVSMSGHSCLPALRTAMKRPDHFPQALAAAFSIIAAAYAVVAAVGYWYWGNAVSPLATFDLATNSPYSSSNGMALLGGWLQIDRILAALVLVTCSAKIPALVMVIEELLAGLVPSSGSGSGSGSSMGRYEDHLVSPLLESSEQQGNVPSQNWWPRISPRHRQFGIRVAIAGSAMAVAVTARDNLGSVLSLVGGACSMATSLILPVLFYIKLSWAGHGKVGRVALGALLALGVYLLVQVTYQGAREMVQQS